MYRPCDLAVTTWHRLQPVSGYKVNKFHGTVVKLLIVSWPNVVLVRKPQLFSDVIIRNMLIPGQERTSLFSGLFRTKSFIKPFFLHGPNVFNFVIPYWCCIIVVSVLNYQHYSSSGTIRRLFYFSFCSLCHIRLCSSDCAQRLNCSWIRLYKLQTNRRIVRSYLRYQVL